MRHEDDLRSALRSLAPEAPDAQALIRRVTAAHVESPPDGTDARRRRSTGRLLLAAAGSTAAIAVVAVVSLAAANMFGNRSAAGPLPPRNVPGYYLAVGPTSLKPGATYLGVVRRTATGAAVATIRPPRPYAGFSDVTGAVDDRTFVVTAQTTNGYNNSTTVAKLYLVRFKPSDNAVTVSALPIPDLKLGLGTVSTALSPDGTELAVATEPIAIPVAATSRITLYSVASGRVLARWNTRVQMNPFSLSWSRGGTLAFEWTAGLRLLNTAVGSGRLMADSRPAYRHAYCPALEGFPFPSDGFLTPDGTRIVALRSVPVKPGERADSCKQPSEPTPGQKQYPFGTRTTAPSLELFSAATGKALRVIYRSPSLSLKPSYGVSWSNPDGSVLVIDGPTSANPAGWARFGVLRDGVFRPLPGLPDSQYLSEYTTLAF
jgi:hypothetical protein